jgi:hypothetical protein
MNPLAPLDTSLFLKTSASSSALLTPLLYDAAVYGLEYKDYENSLYDKAPL